MAFDLLGATRALALDGLHARFAAFRDALDLSLAVALQPRIGDDAHSGQHAQCGSREQHVTFLPLFEARGDGLGLIETQRTLQAQHRRLTQRHRSRSHKRLSDRAIFADRSGLDAAGVENDEAWPVGPELQDVGRVQFGVLYAIAIDEGAVARIEVVHDQFRTLEFQAGVHARNHAPAVTVDHTVVRRIASDRHARRRNVDRARKAILADRLQAPAG